MKAERWPANALIAVFGATGTGKSKLAVSLAKKFGGEVINADAMQLYEGLPIVTNKISPEEMAGVKHHLLGNIGLNAQPWTVSQYVKHASSAIEEIRRNGKLPILVGGTHYYTQALLIEGQTVTGQGAEYLGKAEQAEQWPILKGSDSQILEKLKEVDPDMAARWHPNDARRIRRSLEIWLQTGRRASEIYAEQKRQSQEALPASQELAAGQQSQGQLKYDTLAFWTHVQGDDLNTRLNERVNSMVQAGLLEEVRQMGRSYQELSSSGETIDVSSGIWIAIGYKEFLEYLSLLESGTATEAELSKCLLQAVEKTKTATRQYAKKQDRWIRLKLLPVLQNATSDPRVFPLNATVVENWQSQVEDPAVQIADSFLKNKELAFDILPDQSLLSLLTKSDSVIEERLPRAKTCEVCGVVMNTVSGERVHMASRRHKKMTKKAQLRQSSEEDHMNILK